MLKPRHQIDLQKCLPSSSVVIYNSHWFVGYLLNIIPNVDTCNFLQVGTTYFLKHFSSNSSTLVVLLFSFCWCFLSLSRNHRTVARHHRHLRCFYRCGFLCHIDLVQLATRALCFVALWQKMIRYEMMTNRNSRWMWCVATRSAVKTTLTSPYRTQLIHKSCFCCWRCCF